MEQTRCDFVRPFENKIYGIQYYSSYADCELVFSWTLENRQRFDVMDELKKLQYLSLVSKVTTGATRCIEAIVLDL